MAEGVSSTIPTLSLPRLVGYFLRLGAVGFGGPVALANSIRRDLVETRSWISEKEYDSGLAIAAACPGPLAYQLGVYCGYVRFGVLGGVLVAVAFGLAPFLLVVAVSAAYTRFSGSWQVRALFYGVGPAVVALIVKACFNLGVRTLRKNPSAWAFALIACAVTVIVQRGVGGSLRGRRRPRHVRLCPLRRGPVQLRPNPRLLPPAAEPRPWPSRRRSSRRAA